MFKRVILVASALSMLAAPMAQAQSRHDRPAQHHVQSYKHGYHHAKPRHQIKKHAPRRHVWKRGQHVPKWQRKNFVRDYHRRGLPRPGHGQHWVQIGNEFLLISLATGIIFGMAAAR